jgi:hypothetical protein
VNGVTRAVAAGTSTGSILIEVVVAVALLGFLLMPLAGTALSATDRAHGLREQAVGVGADLPSEGTLEAWDWGTRAMAAWWRPGPTLHVKTRGKDEQRSTGGPAVVVGLWVDGWFLGERSADAEGAVEVGPEVLSASVSRELVVRVRRPGTSWGPPWRSLVPGAEGVVALPPSGQENAGVGGEVVAHPPAAGTPDFRASWAGDGGDGGALGLPIVFQSAPPGPCGLSLGVFAQSWLMEAGRGLDMYF